MLYLISESSLIIYLLATVIQHQSVNATIPGKRRRTEVCGLWPLNFMAFLAQGP